MTALPGWRQWAAKLSQHAAGVLTGARSNQAARSWADAMRCELDYIEDDRAALRWALGCVVASYKARLAARPGFTCVIGMRDVLRHAAACGALMLIIGIALLGNAESQTEPPRPAADETACNTPNAVPDTGQPLPSATAGMSPDAGHPARMPDPAAETGCAGRHAPGHVLPEYPTR